MARKSFVPVNRENIKKKTPTKAGYFNKIADIFSTVVFWFKHVWFKEDSKMKE